jgi:type VI protein secretion system component Hcp
VGLAVVAMIAALTPLGQSAMAAVSQAGQGAAPVVVQNTTDQPVPVNVGTMPNVKLDPTGNTVQLDQTHNGVSQAGTWNVGISGTPNVGLSSSGNTVKLDPSANTVKLDNSSPLLVTSAGSTPSSTVPFVVQLSGVTSTGDPIDSGGNLISDLMQGIKFSWGATLPTTTSTSGGETAGSPKVGSITFVKPVDQYSPKLLTDLLGGTHATTGTITFLTRDSHGYEVDHTIALHTVMVTGVSDNVGDPGQVNDFSNQQVETVTLDFDAFNYTNGNNSVIYNRSTGLAN